MQFANDSSASTEDEYSLKVRFESVNVYIWGNNAESASQYPTNNSTVISDSWMDNTTDKLSDCIHSGARINGTLFSQYPVGLLDFGAICCIVFAIVGIIGNFISIIALSKCTKLRNATTAFIVNLCVADLLFCGFSLPLSAVTFLEREWNYGDVLCKLFPLFRYSNGAVSIFSIIAITFNRYVLIVHPRVYPSMYKPCYTGFVIAIIWVTAVGLLCLPMFQVWGTFGYDPTVGTCSIMRFHGKSPKMFLYIAAFALPSAIFLYCYSLIFRAVRQASKNVRRDFENSVKLSNSISFSSKQKWISNSPQGYPRRNASDMMPFTSSPRMNRQELKVLKVIMMIFITFILCYFPVSFVKIFRKEDDLPVLNILGYLGVYFSNCINPIIYVVMSKEYRKAYIELFTRKQPITDYSKRMPMKNVNTMSTMKGGKGVIYMIPMA